MDVDRGQLVRRHLSGLALVVRLHELSPVGQQDASRRDWQRFERFDQMGQNLPDWLRLADKKSVTTGGYQECKGQGWLRTRKGA